MAERAAQIDDALDFIEKELRSVQVIKELPLDLAPTQIENCRCAALDLSTAICNFLADVIHDRLRSTPRKVTFEFSVNW